MNKLYDEDIDIDRSLLFPSIHCPRCDVENSIAHASYETARAATNEGKKDDEDTILPLPLIC